MNLPLLIQIRAETGLTQKDMAQKLNYKNKASYCLIENGKTKVTIDLALKIKNILKLNEDDFNKIFFEN
ncbi:helix-turn-helix transcriptional regulator [Clostridium pasteurianum]|uniref:Putative transcriptional regulator n=1 Tax=Clostridium pasteurianum BC1 TaxID=86416 RepID=R4JX30_CLOPA|nr:helix-turn-helix transcriptional regulator [Clostridium pasteurianum]AGK95377.1 putative transcriptional regulator [Clostridium pasteurianum BC1]